MSWQQYHLGFRLLSPLHVGASRVGNLQRTRRYVHGKAVWAALTARLARDGSGRAAAADYVNMGKCVRKQFRFGYLFVATGPHTKLDQCWPWENDFDYRFLSSYASAALTANNSGADPGLLHETEFIGNFSRPVAAGGCPEPVYLSGDLWVQDKGVAGWEDALEAITIGGERGYGWGRLKRVSLTTGALTDEEEPSPSPVDKRAVAHVLAPAPEGRVRGPVEAVVGWERDNSGAGVWRVSGHRLCYLPGAVAKEEARFSIREDGIWECLP